MRTMIIALTLACTAAMAAHASTKPRHYAPDTLGVPRVDDCGRLPYAEEQRACLDDLEAYYHPNDAEAQARALRNRQEGINGYANPYAPMIPLQGQPADVRQVDPLNATRGATSPTGR